MTVAADIIASSAADKRTRNRLREHGPRFWINHRGHPWCFSGQEAIRVTSPTGWHGWLLSHMIEVTEVT